MTPAEFPTTPTQERDMDLTQITTPFGLLDDETRATLEAHGGPYEYWNSPLSPLQWADVGNPMWNLGAIYRVKPQKPTKPSIDWSHVAPKYKWLARDSNDEAFVYAERPFCEGGYWVWNGGSPDPVQVDRLLASYAPGTCDWRDSLVQRPEDV